MPGYIEKLIQWFNHIMPKKPINTPYNPPPKTYGKESQTPFKTNTLASLDKHGIREIRQIFRAILYDLRTIDFAISVGLRSIASEQ